MIYVFYFNKKFFDVYKKIYCYCFRKNLKQAKIKILTLFEDKQFLLILIIRIKHKLKNHIKKIILFPCFQTPGIKQQKFKFQNTT